MTEFLCDNSLYRHIPQYSQTPKDSNPQYCLNPHDSAYGSYSSGEESLVSPRNISISYHPIMLEREVRTDGNKRCNKSQDSRFVSKKDRSSYPNYNASNHGESNPSEFKLSKMSNGGHQSSSENGYDYRDGVLNNNYYFTESNKGKTRRERSEQDNLSSSSSDFDYKKYLKLLRRNSFSNTGIGATKKFVPPKKIMYDKYSIHDDATLDEYPSGDRSVGERTKLRMPLNKVTDVDIDEGRTNQGRRTALLQYANNIRNRLLTSQNMRNNYASGKKFPEFNSKNGRNSSYSKNKMFDDSGYHTRHKYPKGELFDEESINSIVTKYTGASIEDNNNMALDDYNVDSRKLDGVHDSFDGNYADNSMKLNDITDDVNNAFNDENIKLGSASHHLDNNKCSRGNNLRDGYIKNAINSNEIFPRNSCFQSTDLFNPKLDTEYSESYSGIYVTDSKHISDTEKKYGRYSDGSSRVKNGFVDIGRKTIRRNSISNPLGNRPLFPKKTSCVDIHIVNDFQLNEEQGNLNNAFNKTCILSDGNLDPKSAETRIDVSKISPFIKSLGPEEKKKLEHLLLYNREILKKGGKVNLFNPINEEHADGSINDYDSIASNPGDLSASGAEMVINPETRDDCNFSNERYDDALINPGDALQDDDAVDGNFVHSDGGEDMFPARKVIRRMTSSGLVRPVLRKFNSYTKLKPNTNGNLHHIKEETFSNSIDEENFKPNRNSFIATSTPIDEENFKPNRNSFIASTTSIDEENFKPNRNSFIATTTSIDEENFKPNRNSFISTTTPIDEENFKPNRNNFMATSYEDFPIEDSVCSATPYLSQVAKECINIPDSNSNTAANPPNHVVVIRPPRRKKSAKKAKQLGNFTPANPAGSYLPSRQSICRDEQNNIETAASRTLQGHAKRASKAKKKFIDGVKKQVKSTFMDDKVKNVFVDDKLKKSAPPQVKVILVAIIKSASTVCVLFVFSI